MKFYVLTSLCLWFSLWGFGQSNQQFSQKAVLNDLKALRESLEDAHYNLYAYTTKQAFEAAYLEVKNSIRQDSFSLLEAINLFQRLITVVKNGHTEIDFPGQSYREYAYSGGTLFPLELAFEDGKSLIRKNWSANKDIKIGSEVISINGKPIDEILSEIYPQISAERLYFKLVKLEFYSFPRYYWQVFGEQDDFEVELRSNGATQQVQLKAIKALDGYEKKRTDVLNAKMNLKFLDKAAYLNPGDFSGDEVQYRHFIDSAFVAIKKQKQKNLIIDLRNNRGGNEPFSNYLVSYIADQPFHWQSSFTLKTSKFLKEHIRQHFDTTSTYWQTALRKEDGEVYEYTFDPYQPQAEEKRFKGKVYVLVNRQSYSQSAVAAAQLQDYKYGIIVGEETGDFPTLYASQFQYELPQTGIPVKVSKGYIIRVNGSTKAEGVIPDIIIKDHLLDEQDEILEELLQKLK